MKATRFTYQPRHVGCASNNGRLFDSHRNHKILAVNEEICCYSERQTVNANDIFNHMVSERGIKTLKGAQRGIIECIGGRQQIESLF